MSTPICQRVTPAPYPGARPRVRWMQNSTHLPNLETGPRRSGTVVDTTYRRNNHTPPPCADLERKNPEAGRGLVDIDLLDQNFLSFTRSNLKKNLKKNG